MGKKLYFIVAMACIVQICIKLISAEVLDCNSIIKKMDSIIDKSRKDENYSISKEIDITFGESPIMDSINNKFQHDKEDFAKSISLDGLQFFFKGLVATTNNKVKIQFVKNCFQVIENNYKNLIKKVECVTKNVFNEFLKELKSEEFIEDKNDENKKKTEKEIKETLVIGERADGILKTFIVELQSYKMELTNSIYKGSYQEAVVKMRIYTEIFKKRDRAISADIESLVQKLNPAAIKASRRYHKICKYAANESKKMTEIVLACLNKNYKQ